jgi:hypothetical protein
MIEPVARTSATATAAIARRQLASPAAPAADASVVASSPWVACSTAARAAVARLVADAASTFSDPVPKAVRAADAPPVEGGDPPDVRVTVVPGTTDATRAPTAADPGAPLDETETPDATPARECVASGAEADAGWERPLRPVPFALVAGEDTVCPALDAVPLGFVAGAVADDVDPAVVTGSCAVADTGVAVPGAATSPTAELGAAPALGPVPELGAGAGVVAGGTAGAGAVAGTGASTPGGGTAALGGRSVEGST